MAKLETVAGLVEAVNRTLPTLESMDRTLRELNEKQDLRLCTLENQMETLEMRTENKIKTEACKIKSEVAADLKANVKTMVDELLNKSDWDATEIESVKNHWQSLTNLQQGKITTFLGVLWSCMSYDGECFAPRSSWSC